MQQSETIPNWDMFGIRHTQVQIFNQEDNYRAGLFLLIDNTTEEDDEHDYNVTLFTEIYHEDKIQCAKLAFIYASTLFDNMDPIVKSWNPDGTEDEDIDLRSIKMTPDGHALQ